MSCLLVQVLLACVKCPGGCLLTNDNVINIFQASFRIGHGDAHKVSNGELLAAPANHEALHLAVISLCHAVACAEPHT